MTNNKPHSPARWERRLEELVRIRQSPTAANNARFARAVLTALEDAGEPTDDIRLFADEDDAIEFRRRTGGLIHTIRASGPDNEYIRYDLQAREVNIMRVESVADAARLLAKENK